jgi:EAL domain-containing protein (putative c-di-GMP-specific phosphodiesterase class I)
MPEEFLSALEDHPEVGRAFGLEMIQQASHDLQTWLVSGLDIKRIAVNVSNLELRADDYHERLLGMLKEVGLTSDRFEIEVTETTAFDDNIAAIGRNLRILAEQGVHIALDDFGTGFASLTHLKSLPISHVKIDRSFVRNIVADPESHSIVDAIVRLSHSMGKSVVAEGVEDEAQLATIRGLKCDIAQGYWFSRPIPREQVPSLLLRHASKRAAIAGRIGDEDTAPAVALKRAS